MTVIREAAVAGQFYPGNASELGAEIRVFFEAVQAAEGPAPKALIVPHAGCNLACNLSSSRDFEISQFWQNLQARLQPAVPNESTGVPGRK